MPLGAFAPIFIHSKLRQFSNFKLMFQHHKCQNTESVGGIGDAVGNPDIRMEKCAKPDATMDPSPRCMMGFT